jgi:hypothetical protein
MPPTTARTQRKSEGSDQAISATRCARSSAAKSALDRFGRVMIPKWLCMSAIGTRASAPRAAIGPSASVGSVAHSSARRVKPRVVVEVSSIVVPASEDGTRWAYAGHHG